jgi:DnaK suppressor protein
VSKPSAKTEPIRTSAKSAKGALPVPAKAVKTAVTPKPAKSQPAGPKAGAGTKPVKAAPGVKAPAAAGKAQGTKVPPKPTGKTSARAESPAPETPKKGAKKAAPLETASKAVEISAVKGPPLKTTAEKALPAAQAAAPAAVAPDPAPAAKTGASTPTPAPPPAPRERAKSGAANRPQPAPASPASTRLSGASAADAKLALTSFPGPSSHRFTDRFAPAPMAAARAMTEISDSPKPVTKVDPKLANAWKTKPGRELSEPELLAMPEAEYMNDKQLDFFRKRLHQQRDDLLSNAGETTEHLREDTSIVPDPADRATIEEEHALELRTRDRERKLLKKISQSIARLDSGEYGYCDETGEPIGLPRLLARPTATLSLEAQQRRELKQKMFGD